MSARTLKLGSAVVAVLAHLEREYGQARLLVGVERQAVATALGRWRRCVVVDIGEGRIATVGPRGGGLLIHEPKAEP